MISTERDELIDELTKTLIILGVTWNPRPVARGLIDKNYRKVTEEYPSIIGHWDHYSTTMMECSVCKKHVPKHRYNFCPECGTKMQDRIGKTGKWLFWEGWIGNHDKRIEDATCSECGYQHPTVRRAWQSNETAEDVLNKLATTCPSCGAKMKIGD